MNRRRDAVKALIYLSNIVLEEEVDRHGPARP
jgi:hypothetical protein